MIALKRPRGLLLAALIGLLVTSFAHAQTAGTTTGTGTNNQPTFARDNVKGGALKARTPGLWLGKAKARHVDFQQAALKDFGGATISEQGPEAGRWEVFANTAVGAVFDFLNNLATQLKLLLALQRGTGG